MFVNPPIDVSEGEHEGRLKMRDDIVSKRNVYGSLRDVAEAIRQQTSS